MSPAAKSFCKSFAVIDFWDVECSKKLGGPDNDDDYDLQTDNESESESDFDDESESESESEFDVRFCCVSLSVHQIYYHTEQ